MQDAVIVSTARTPIAKAWRGAFNDLTTPSMSAIAIRAQQIRGEGMQVVVGAGHEQISLVQQAHMQAANAAQDATVRRLCEQRPGCSLMKARQACSKCSEAPPSSYNEPAWH